MAGSEKSNTSFIVDAMLSTIVDNILNPFLQSKQHIRMDILYQGVNLIFKFARISAPLIFVMFLTMSLLKSTHTSRSRIRFLLEFALFIIIYSSIFICKLLDIDIKSPRLIQLSVLGLFFTGRSSLAFVLWIYFLTKASVCHLIAISGALGYLTGCLKNQDQSQDYLLLYYTMASTFFYTGNSNSISTIDVSAGYIGLNSYIPVMVAVQIHIYTYMGPICFIIGWFHSLPIHDEKFHSILALFRAVLLFRIVALFACQLSLVFHRYHLFIWSVFAPKFLYEIAHFITVIVILLLITVRHTFF